MVVEFEKNIVPKANQYGRIVQKNALRTQELVSVSISRIDALKIMKKLEDDLYGKKD